MNNLGSLSRFAPILIGVVTVLFFLAKGCQEGPFGRSQLVTISPEQELQLGKQSFTQILSQSRVQSDTTVESTAVRRIGDRLAQASKHPKIRELLRIKGERPFEWEYRVVEDKQVNAFCLPGGKVVVYTGILPIAETEQGLAVVMGHEIGHALARHGAERMAQTQVAQIGQMAVASSLGDLDPAKQQAVMGMLSAGTQMGLLKYGRSHESEADKIGILLMAAAGYDPREAAKFWMRMPGAKEGGKAPPEFLSTHPSHETRQRDLQILADSPEVQELYQKSSKAENRPLPIRGGNSFSPNPLSPDRFRPAPKANPNPPAKTGAGVRFE